MTLSDLIIRHRLEHKLSQRQFANACGVSNGYISMLEKNKNPNTGLPLTPTLPMLKKIASGMGLSTNELLLQADDMSVELALSSDDENALTPISRDERIDEIVSQLGQLSAEELTQITDRIEGILLSRQTPLFPDPKAELKGS